MRIMCVQPQLLSHSPLKPAANERGGALRRLLSQGFVLSWISAHHMVGLDMGGEGGPGHHMAPHQSLSDCQRLTCLGWCHMEIM